MTDSPAQALAATVQAAIDHAYIDGHCDGSAYEALASLVALADGAAAQLQHFKECADTPLMRDVMAARDAAEARVTALEAEIARLKEGSA